MTTDIFNNDILSGDLNNSLVPELGTEDISLNITSTESSYTDPLNQDLSLTEPEIVVEENENSINNNSAFNNNSSFNNLVVSNIDSFIGGDVQKFQVNELDVNDTSFAPPQSELQFQGGFGDYDGGNDVPLEIKDNDGNVIETFKLSGEGQASLYRDEEYQYVFFSGVDETTNVDIDSTSNIKFGDYIGDSLEIETSGSIEGGDIVLNDENTEVDSGLTLRAGIDTENSVGSVFDGYTLVDFNTHREMVDINYYGQIVGNDTFSGTETFFFYDGQRVNYLPGYESSRAFGINDYNQMIGEGVSLTSDDPHVPFLVFGNGTVEEFTYGEGGAGRPSPNSSGADVVYTYDPLAHPRDINNFVEIASYQLNTLPENAPPELQPRSFEDAIFQTPGGIGAVNIGYELLNSDNSRAFGINNPGNVVGINRETDRAFVFNREDNSVTNLGTLPGGDYSAAYAINDVGQVVGVSTSGSGSRAFIYENGIMKDMGVSYTGNPESRVGIDINNLGQAVITSAEGEAFVYQDGVVTNINNWLRPEVLDLGYTITEAKGINDRGQIIAQGTYDNSERGFLLNPTFQEVNRNIKVGKISTFGETVLLEGAEVYLEGKTIVTQGGNITFDGKTKVNRNLTINSSVTEDEVITDGGNITFTNTVDGNQNLTLKAGTGNILFSDVVGSNATFSDVAVEGAGSVTINNDLAINGNLSLEVINDITTANLSAGGLVNISLGKIGDEVYPSIGNVTTGNIDALGLEVLNNGNFTAGDLTTTDGDINAISLNQLTVGQLTATNGAIDLISGTAGITVNGTVQGDNGFIALAQQDIVTNEITSSQDAVILKSSQGAVTVNGSVTAFGDASIAAAGDVTVGAVTSNDESVALISATGIVNLGGAVSSMEDVTVASAQSLTIDQEIKAELGSIALGSTEGSVTASVAIDSAIGVNIAAKQNVSTKRIRTYGGDVVIDAQQGTTTIGGVINSRGGDIRVSGFNTVRTKNLISRSGNVSIISDTSLARTGYIRTDRGNRNGDVYLEAGRNVRVGRAVEIDGEQYSIYAGDDGVINVAYQQNKKDNKRGQFVIGSPTGNGTLALVTSPVTTPIPTPPAGGGVQPNPILIYIEIFRRVLDAGGTAPRHQSEINPITAKPYFDEAEFELAQKFTPNQQNEIIKFVNVPTYRLDFEYVEEKGKFDTQNETGCFVIPLSIHLGNNAYHNQYADDVTGMKGDVIVIPPSRIGVFASTTYDGIVRAGSKATLLAPPQVSQKIGDLAEVKTGYTALNNIVSGNSDSDDFNLYNQLVNQVIKEAVIAKACQKKYFIAFDRKSVANSGRQLLNNDPRIQALGLTIKVNHIISRPLIKLKEE